jgi:hypothetical protein
MASAHAVSLGARPASGPKPSANGGVGQPRVLELDETAEKVVVMLGGSVRSGR